MGASLGFWVDSRSVLRSLVPQSQHSGLWEVGLPLGPGRQQLAAAGPGLPLVSSPFGDSVQAQKPLLLMKLNDLPALQAQLGNSG